MKRNMYSAEYNEVTVKITEKQFDRLDSYEVLELLIKKGLPITNNFDRVSCLINTSKIVSLNCFKRTSLTHLHKGKVVTIKLMPLWLL